MFTKVTPKYQLLLEDELERSFLVLNSLMLDNPEYAKTLTYIERLNGLRDAHKPSVVSKDTWVNVGANLLGILMIIKHENVNVISSKALSFVHRVK